MGLREIINKSFSIPSPDWGRLGWGTARKGKTNPLPNPVLDYSGCRKVLSFPTPNEFRFASLYRKSAPQVGAGVLKYTVALLCLLITLPSFASVAVSPTKIEINANKIRNNYATAAIEVRGEAKNAVRFKIIPEYFVITSDSRMNTEVPKGDPHDISSSLRFVPSEFTVPAGKSQKVRVNIANIKNLPDGESRAVLFLEDVNTKEMNIPNNAGIGAQLIIKTRVGIPVYVDKGKFTKTGDIDYLKIVKEKDGLYTEMKVLSKGNSKIRYTGKVQVIKDKKLVDEYNLESKVVGNNNFYVAKQKIQTQNIKDAGEYTLRVVLSYFDENSNRKNIKKDVVLNIKNDV